MDEIKVGDICEGQNFESERQCNGMECVVVGGLEMRDWWHEDGTEGCDPMYEVEWADGVASVVEPQHLRKRRPPSTDEAAARQAMLDCIQRAKQGSGVSV